MSYNELLLKIPEHIKTSKIFKAACPEGVVGPATAQYWRTHPKEFTDACEAHWSPEEMIAAGVPLELINKPIYNTAQIPEWQQKLHECHLVVVDFKVSKVNWEAPDHIATATLRCKSCGNLLIIQ